MRARSGFSSVMGIVLLALASGAAPAGGSVLSAQLSLGAPVVTGPGGTANFNVTLNNLVTNSPSNVVLAFGLDFGSSSPTLTAGGTDFSAFSFVLDPGLIGVIGSIVYDDNASDDGHVQFGASVPPFGSETGISAAMGSVLLGVLSVTAPFDPGSYPVAFRIDASAPLLATYLEIYTGNEVAGPVLPTDGPLDFVNSSVEVPGGPALIPEPSSILLWSIAALGAALLPRRNRRHSPNRTGHATDLP